MNSVNTGYILFLPRFIGTKSERFYPCLIQAEADVKWVKYHEDDPFNHHTLRPFHLKYVEAMGIDADDGVFCIKAIKEIPPPYPRTHRDVLH